MRTFLLTLLFVVSGSAVYAQTGPEFIATKYAPLPEYPPEARARGLGGSGVFIIHVEPKSGKVKFVTIEKSTGYSVLDQAAVDSLKRWKFIPNKSAPIVKVPFTFTATGSTY